MSQMGAHITEQHPSVEARVFQLPVKFVGSSTSKCPPWRNEGCNSFGYTRVKAAKKRQESLTGLHVEMPLRRVNMHSHLSQLFVN